MLTQKPMKKHKLLFTSIKYLFVVSIHNIETNMTIIFNLAVINNIVINKEQ